MTEALSIPQLQAIGKLLEKMRDIDLADLGGRCNKCNRTGVATKHEPGITTLIICSQCNGRGWIYLNKEAEAVLHG